MKLDVTDICLCPHIHISFEHLHLNICNCSLVIMHKCIFLYWLPPMLASSLFQQGHGYFPSLISWWGWISTSIFSRTNQVWTTSIKSNPQDSNNKDMMWLVQEMKKEKTYQSEPCSWCNLTQTNRTTFKGMRVKHVFVQNSSMKSYHR